MREGGEGKYWRGRTSKPEGECGTAKPGTLTCNSSILLPGLTHNIHLQGCTGSRVNTNCGVAVWKASEVNNEASNQWA
eukprot:8523607-Pyramimonas_sp.AAC.1